MHPRRRNGFSLVELLVVAAIIGVLMGILVQAVMKVRDASASTRCLNSMKQLGIALHDYEVANSSLPAGVSGSQTATPFATWLTRLLPHLDQTPLWKQSNEAFRADSNFRNAAHAALLARRMDIFLCAAETRGSPAADGPLLEAFTNYLGCEGVNQYSRDGLLFLGSAVRFAEVVDGQSNTIMAGERPVSGTNNRFGWWYAGVGQNDDGSADSVLGAREDAVEVSLGTCYGSSNRFQRGKPQNPCDNLHFWSFHSGGANFLFADASVRFLAYDADKVLPALATRAGGESAGY